MAVEDPDRALLERAVALSREKMLAGEGGPFGALVALDGEVIAEGWNRVTSTDDPTAHAEIVAIREACRELGRFELRGGVLYTSCEPCPMCLAATYWARLDRLVYANTRADAAAIEFDDAFLYDQIALPLGEQTLPSRQIELASAREVFELWRAKEDKIRY
jgi:tRNA(Arg) A34 adenosine deaminase TadA